MTARKNFPWVFSFVGLLLSLFVIRIYFLATNFNLFKNDSASELLPPFILGLRFDLATIAVLNSPILCFIFLGLCFPKLRTAKFIGFLRLCFCLINIPMLLIALIDCEFFKFTGKHSTLAVFAMGQDMQNQFWQLAKNYWYVSILGISLSVAIWKLSSFLKNLLFLTGRNYLQTLLGLALTVFCVRGGLQLKPLNPTHAYVFSSPSLADLALNTPFVCMHAIGKEKKKHFEFYDSWNKVLEKIAVPEPTPIRQVPLKENVIVIILESFAAEYSGLTNSYQGYTPFLDSLARQGLWFTHSYANGRRSIEASTTVLAGIPSLMEEPLITSDYHRNKIYGIAEILGKNGYSTAFFHGGDNGTMYFDIFAKMTRFTNYFGFNEYPNPKDTDGTWGIFDKPFLKFSADKISQMPAPFFASIFSLTSHNPYPIPSEDKNKFPKGTLPIHEVIGYSDYALGQFFAYAKTKPWYSHTLFVLTGDHTSATEASGYNNELGSYRVPIIFYHPVGLVAAAQSNKTAQHVDIQPSILHWLGIKTPWQNYFGHSVFDPKFNGRALNSIGGTSWLEKDQKAVILQGNQEAKFVSLPPFNHHEDQGEGLMPVRKENAPALLEELHGLLQYFESGMEEDKIYVPVSPKGHEL